MKTKLLTICLLFLTTTIFLSGCAGPIKNIEVFEEFKPESKTVVFLNSSRYHNEFRSALTKYRFKVKKYATIDVVTKKNDDEEVSYNKAEARYGIELFYDVFTHCLTLHTNKMLIAYVSVVDLKTNDVVLQMEMEGFPKPCGLAKGGLFKNIAKELNKHWK